MNSSVLFAVPSNNPGGLEAGRSDHFGHCDVFTIIRLENDDVAEVGTVENQEHEAGGCMVPVRFLKERNVKAIVVGGIGARPLQGFIDAGIDVFYADRRTAGTVRSVVEGMLKGQFPIIRPDQACNGHGNCH